MKIGAFLFVSFFCLSMVASRGGVVAAPMNKFVADKAEDVHPLKSGDSIPDGILKTLDGKDFHFKSEILKKPTVLIFYRGGWCPYCNLQMGQLVKIEPKLLEMGYQMLAISPDKPEKLKESLDKHQINYTLLSDRSMELTRKFHLAYRLNPETLAKMKSFGVDLDSATGNQLHLLPVPAAYVVDQKGIIHYVYFNPDIKVRVDTDELLKVAQEAIHQHP